MCNAPPLSPERETIIECIHSLIRELDCPGRSAVNGFVDAKICGVISNGHQVGELVAHALHLPELEIFASRHDSGLPALSAVSCDHICTASSGCADHAGVHCTQSNQHMRATALL